MDIAKLEEARTLMIKTIKDTYPNIDTRKGTVIHDLLVTMAALGYATISEDLASFEDKMFLQQVLEDPASTDTSTVDAILSNFFVTRKSGSRANGLVKIEVSENREYFVISGAQFTTVDGLVYNTIQSYSISTSDLFVQGDAYYFFVEVYAENVGSSYTIGANTILETTILSGSIISAESFNDFQGGIDEETNEVLLSRAASSFGAKALSHRQAISTLLQEQFPDIRQLTVTGYNDREMQRDRNNAGFKVGGKSDVYVRTIVAPLTKSIEKTTDTAGRVFLNDADAGEVPILRVKQIALANNPIGFTDNFTVVALGPLPFPQYYRFSDQESLEIQTPYNSQKILVTVDYLPLIREIQDYVNDDEVKYIRSDTLVRSYMPCFINLEVTYRSESDISVVAPLIRTALIELINTYDQDVLYVSKIVDVLHNIDIINIELPLSVTGTFHLPNGSKTTQTSENSIGIEEDIVLGISQKTYRFFITSSDIVISQK